jgi:membrane-associated phospholipid phosphatase
MEDMFAAMPPVTHGPSLRQTRSLRRRALCTFLSCLLPLAAGMRAWTQAPAPAGASLPDAPTAQPPVQDDVTLRTVPRDILKDQEGIWTSPVRLRPRDLEWLAPLALATGAAIATDHRAMTQVVSRDPDFNQANINVSNALIGGWIAAPVAIYGYGHFHESAHAHEAGILSGEVMVDGVVVEQAMKLIFWRERPGVDNSRGRFFQSNAGADSSFPSSHSIVAWSAASALASEYPAPWTQFALYSAAAGVSLTRVMGQQHFPSDVLVGSAAGWLIGHYVVHRHRHRLHDEHIAHRSLSVSGH